MVRRLRLRGASVPRRCGALRGAAVVAAGLAVGGGADLGAPRAEWLRVLERLPAEELRDVDCDRVSGGLARWPDVRAQAQLLDEQWTAVPPPPGVCDELGIASSSSEAQIAVARAADAGDECVLGALAAALLVLVCASGGGAPEGAAAAPAVWAFEYLWREALAGARAVPSYMLGTTSWPVASLLAKWQASAAAPPGPRPAVCDAPEALAFLASVQGYADEFLMPVLRGNTEAADRLPTLLLGNFAIRFVPALAHFMNSATAAEPALYEDCPDVAATQGALLLLLRILGPPSKRDPLHGARLAELGATLARLSLADLLWRLPSAVFAGLATSNHMAWRSHRLYGGGADVPIAELRSALRLGVECLQASEATGERPPELPGRYGSGLLESLHDDAAAQRRLWRRVEASAALGPLWRQLARWLRSGDAGPPAPVFFCMGFGSMTHEAKWQAMRNFFRRALDVGLKRLVFVTPERARLLECEAHRRAWGAEARLLCVRTLSHFSRIYDANNKAKFFLFPIVLALGLDVAWLDLDIFLFQDPTPRLLEQAYTSTPWPRDVLVTDHFDEYCLNHGVFIVRASDRSLLWLLEYIKWLHWYPYGHDQNGWDAFLGHSIVEPQLPENLRTDPSINVSYGLLSTEWEYLTLSGWAGQGVPAEARRNALLLHFTSTSGITGRHKMLQLGRLFNATGGLRDDEVKVSRRLDMARWKVLRQLEMGLPRMKRPCFEGIHIAVGPLMQSGMYDELLA